MIKLFIMIMSKKPPIPSQPSVLPRMRDKFFDYNSCSKRRYQNNTN